MNKLPLLACSAMVLLSACSLETTTQWQAPPDGAFGTIAVAATGDEGALVYAESAGWTGEAFTQTLIKLQRVDSEGAFRGPAIKLGVIEGEGISRVTVASDGNQYIACWEYNAHISCAKAPREQGNASPGLSMPGRWPALAYGSSGWALAYTIPGQLAVLPVAADAMAAGNAVLFDGSEKTNSQIFLAATQTGFVLLGETQQTMRVHHLDSAFSAIVAPIDLSLPFWFYGGMAVSETNVAVHLAVPYGSEVFVLDDNGITEKREFGNADKMGLNAALCVDGTSFGMLSANMNYGLDYGLIEESDALPPSFDHTPPPPSESKLDVNRVDYSWGSLALLTLKDAPFLAATPNWKVRGGEVIVARAHRE